MLQTEAVIQHTVRCDSDFIFPQLVHRLALHDIAEEEMNVRSHVVFFGNHFLREGTLFREELSFHDPLRVQHCCPVKFLPVHLPVDFHSVLGIGRLHHKKQLIVPQISFHRIVPSLITDVQEVSENLYIDLLPAALIKAVAQLIAGFLHFPRICLFPLFELF